MNDPRQHTELLYEHRDKAKIDCDDLQKFANIKESIENQKYKNKPGSVNQIKGKGKSSHKQPAKNPVQKDTQSENKCGKCRNHWHETQACNSNYCKIVSNIFIKLTCVT